jgi:hypothetical protein
MPESTGDPPIIINGGSVTIQFDDTQLTGGGGRHHNSGKKIKRIEVTGSGININETIQDPKDITVKIYYGD